MPKTVNVLKIAFPFILSLISIWVIRVPLVYLIVFILKLSIVYVWMGIVIQWLFEGTVMFYLFKCKSRKWHQD